MLKRNFATAVSVQGESQQTAQLVDLLVNTPAAMLKWADVADDLVKAPDDWRKIQMLITNGEPAAAIRRTLDLWAGCGRKERPDLFRSLGYHGIDPIGAHIDRANHEDLVRLRDTFVNDLGALTKWTSVMDRILAREPVADRLRIRQQLEEGRYEEAVLQTLLHWRSSGVNRVDLKGVLQMYSLDPMPAEIGRACGDQSRPIRPRSTPTARTWIIVTAVLSLVILGACAVLAVPLYDTMFKSRTEPVTTEAGRGLAPSEGAGGVWFEVDDIPSSFTGRLKELEYLSKTFRTPGSHGNIISLFGTGGVGKSTLVRKFALDNKDAYDGNVVWITNGGTHASVRASYLRLIAYLGFRQFDEVSNDELTGMIFGYFFKRKCLFIFDDVPEEPSDPSLRQFQLKIVNLDGKMHDVIMISCNYVLSPPAPGPAYLQPLTKSDAMALIQSQLPNATNTSAAELAEKLQRLPLPIQQAVALIRDRQGGGDEAIREYLDDLTKFSQYGQQPVGQSAGTANKYVKESINSAIFATTSAAVSRMLEANMNMRRHLTTVLNILAFLNPDLITVQLLEEIMNQSMFPIKPVPLETILNTLESVSMVRVTKGRIVLHFLVGDVVRARMMYGEDTFALAWIAAVLGRMFNSSSHSDLTREATSHGLRLFSFFVNRPLLMTDYFVFVYKLCPHLLHYGYYMESLNVSEQAWLVYKNHNGADHEYPLYMRLRSAQAHVKLNNYSKATEVLEAILSISIRRYGKGSPLTMEIIHELDDISNWAVAVDLRLDEDL